MFARQASAPAASFEDLGDSVVPGTPRLATPQHAASPPPPLQPAHAPPDAFAAALEQAQQPPPPQSAGVPEAAAAALAAQEGADRTAVDFAQFVAEDAEMAADSEEGD